MPQNWTQSGNGGTTAVDPGQLFVAISQLAASEYPDAATNGILPQQTLWTWDGQPGVYDFWQCQNEYVSNNNVIVVPRSDPTATNVVVAHSSNMITLRKRWAASREGAWPRLPPTDLVDPNWVFVNQLIGVRDMRVLPDGITVVYEASGVYEYQCIDATLVHRTADVQPFLLPLAFGDPENPQAVVNWVDQSLLSSNLTGLAGVLGGAGGNNPLGN